MGAHLLCSSSSIIHQSLSPPSSCLVLDFHSDPFPRRAQPHIRAHPKTGEVSLTPTSRSQALIPSHPIPSPERPALHPCLPLTCFLQVHGGGCLQRRGSRWLTGGRRRLLRGRARGSVLRLLPPLAPRVPQRLPPSAQTGQGAGTATAHTGLDTVPAAGTSRGWPGGGSGAGSAEDRAVEPGETLPPRDFCIRKMPQ